jgi:hypothetical protein
MEKKSSETLKTILLIIVFIFIIVYFSISIDFISKATNKSFTSGTKDFIIWSSISIICVFFFVASTEIYKVITGYTYEKSEKTGKSKNSKVGGVLAFCVSVIIIACSSMLLHLVYQPECAYTKTGLQSNSSYQITKNACWTGLSIAAVGIVLLLVPLIKQFKEEKNEKKIKKEQAKINKGSALPT